MATISHPGSLAPRDTRIDTGSGGVFFDGNTQHELLEEDLLAGKSVCGVLIAIVVGGLMLGILAVLLTL